MALYPRGAGKWMFYLNLFQDSTGTLNGNNKPEQPQPAIGMGSIMVPSSYSSPNTVKTHSESIPKHGARCQRTTGST